MMRSTLNNMSIDELWRLREAVDLILASKLKAEKAALDRRLQQLNAKPNRYGDLSSERRPYPKVFPKFRDPDRPSDTWAGRGKLPRWLSAQIRAGKQIDDFRIEHEIR